ncbi:MAG: hypothetical protein HYV28_03135 [Ignavibacteriales bacterium]|nr:hypothetical protein [Ignavibacteriales bacterium]
MDYSIATYYNAKLGVRLSVDPLLDKYPGLNPYNYCLNNPVNSVDPDGKKVIFAQGSSKAFKENYTKTVNYLKEHNALGPLEVIINSKETITLQEGKIPKYTPKTRTISWAPNKGIFTNSGKTISPATVLVNEADHAAAHISDAKKLIQRQKEKDDNYGNKEEKRVITGSETETAKKLGEIGSSDVTREDHGGSLINTVSPTSTEQKVEIEIKPKEETK